MVVSQAILEELERLDPREWSGEVFRWVLGTRDPLVANVSGARWNPPEVSVLYTALDRATVVAESKYLISSSPARPRVPAHLHTLRVALTSVLDLRERQVLRRLDLHRDLANVAWSVCQEIGAAAQLLRHDGILVPSARHRTGSCLVIFSANHIGPDALLEPIAAEILGESPQGAS